MGVTVTVTVTGGCDGGRGVKERQMMGNGGSDMTGGATLHVMGGRHKTAQLGHAPS